MAKLTCTIVAKALHETHGNISAAARKLNVTRRAIQYRIGKDKALQELLIDARESLVDNAETALAEAVLRGEKWAVMYTLSTLGKSRGYTTRQEHAAAADGAPIPISFIEFARTDSTRPD